MGKFLSDLIGKVREMELDQDENFNIIQNFDEECLNEDVLMYVQDVCEKEKKVLAENIYQGRQFNFEIGKNLFSKYLFEQIAP